MTGAARVARRQDTNVIVEGEFAFTGEDFARIASILYDTAGIALPDSKATLVYSRLAKRLRTIGLQSFREYCALVSSSEGLDERQAMLAALTTNVTRFFREPHHFEHLKANVVAPMADAIRRGARLRIWSAGCSTGQEPYSIALAILSVIPEAPKLDVRILATDIDPNVIATAREGLYSDDLVEPIPTALRNQWLERAGPDRKMWSIGHAARSLVTFNELNLMGNWPMKGKFQSIFCRNVVIYFDEPTQEKMWARFAATMAPNGWLYVGHSERVSLASCPFSNEGLTSYRLTTGGAA
ncbi:MAG: protein-glutamate O-methyltransferase [Hyphomonadaceae bacterium]|nr:MAG: chemotaxis protein methyltransferase CheR [Caulobacteraceae bacterium]MBT9447444.1 protein-glutamate O-methyltransferase [Hyphomonadaceae bacterium]TPW08772.1 MAG: chemotaxis protein methyltransferase CheR [Alphaproteobacteria bacterium]